MYLAFCDFQPLVFSVLHKTGVHFVRIHSDSIQSCVLVCLSPADSLSICPRDPFHADKGTQRVCGKPWSGTLSWLHFSLVCLVSLSFSRGLPPRRNPVHVSHWPVHSNLASKRGTWGMAEEAGKNTAGNGAPREEKEKDRIGCQSNRRWSAMAAWEISLSTGHRSWIF